jgi:hypothetical protein
MKHDVKFSIPERDLGNADIEFIVSGNGSRIGTLRISRGAIVWFPSGNSLGHKTTWKEFGEFMAHQKKTENR